LQDYVGELLSQRDEAYDARDTNRHNPYQTFNLFYLLDTAKLPQVSCRTIIIHITIPYNCTIVQKPEDKSQ
jgi:hypothetical protein